LALYFNYGFNEATWLDYAEKQLRFRMEEGRGMFVCTVLCVFVCLFFGGGGGIRSVGIIYSLSHTHIYIYIYIYNHPPFILLPDIMWEYVYIFICLLFLSFFLSVFHHMWF
jgi:hypothetical protein